MQIMGAHAAVGSPAVVSVSTVSSDMTVIVGRSYETSSPVKITILSGKTSIPLAGKTDTQGRFSASTFLPATYSGAYKVTATAGSTSASTTGSTSPNGTPTKQTVTKTNPRVAPQNPTKAVTPTKTVAGTRNALKQPFSSHSIWNMPIGSGAKYVPANLSGTPGNDPWAPMPQIDDDIIVLDPTAPLTNVGHSSAAWSGADRCKGDGKTLTQVPIPNGYTVPNSGANNSAAILMKDGRTIMQMQPFTRCAAGGEATSLLTFPTEDIYGAGISGAHGGSRMSALGGTIRVGELRPGQQGPRHALKVNVNSPVDLYDCSGDDCFRWPALTSDSGAESGYGAESNNQNKAMKMGALLAIPANVNIASLGLQSVPGKQLAWTLQNYGAYIVDSTGGPAFALEAETGPSGSVRDQFKSDYGYPLEARVQDKTPWSSDVQKIVAVLSVVDNNSATSIGGGGTPRMPLLPELKK
jgi:hypothetical protein